MDFWMHAKLPSKTFKNWRLKAIKCLQYPAYERHPSASRRKSFNTGLHNLGIELFYDRCCSACFSLHCCRNSADKDHLWLCKCTLKHIMVTQWKWLKRPRGAWIEKAARNFASKQVWPMAACGRCITVGAPNSRQNLIRRLMRNPKSETRRCGTYKLGLTYYLPSAQFKSISNRLDFHLSRS